MKTLEFELGYGKAMNPATVKQIKFIDSFDNFSYSKGISTSQVMKRLEIDEASNIIDALKDGYKVVLNVV